MGDAHGHIHAFVEQIHQPVDEQRTCLNTRMRRQKILHDGRHMADTKHLRRCDRQLPLHLGLCATRRLLGFVQICQNRAAVAQKTLAGLRQPHHPRAALQQQHPQPRLQRGNGPGHGCRRAPQAPCSWCKSTCLSNGNKAAQGIEVIHYFAICNFEVPNISIYVVLCNS